MAINRRQFLRTSLAGGSLVLGSKLSGINSVNSELANLNGIVVDYPPSLGKSVLGLRCAPIPTVRIGIVGLFRGAGAVDRLSNIQGTEIVALCDLNMERIKSSQKCAWFIC